MDLFIERAKGGAITVDEDEATVKDYEDHSGTPARLGDLERRIAALEGWKDQGRALHVRRPGRLRRWLIARRLGLRCLVCNRRAGYGGVCPNPEHNG